MDRVSNTYGRLKIIVYQYLQFLFVLFFYKLSISFHRISTQVIQFSAQNKQPIKKLLMKNRGINMFVDQIRKQCLVMRKKKIDYLQQVQKVQTQNRSPMQKQYEIKDTNKRQSSKSTKKSTMSAGDLIRMESLPRRSKRIHHLQDSGQGEINHSSQKLIQLEKEPLWNPSKLNFQNVKKQRKPRSMVSICRYDRRKSEPKVIPKIKYSHKNNHLDQFYGGGFEEPKNKIKINIQIEEPQNNSISYLDIEPINKQLYEEISVINSVLNKELQKPNEESDLNHQRKKQKTKRKKQHQTKKQNKDSQQKYFRDQIIQPQRNMQMNIYSQSSSLMAEEILLNWEPRKIEKSLLSIQRMIDEYFCYQKSFRIRRTVKISQILTYIRQMKGFYCTTQMLDTIMQHNKKLYKKLRIEGNLHLKCKSLKEEDINKRIQKTKKALIKNPIISNFL